MLRRLILVVALMITAAGAVAACSDVKSQTEGYDSQYQPLGYRAHNKTG